MPHVMDRKLLTILQKKSADGNKWGPTEDEYDNYSEITVQSDICVGLNASVRPQPCTPPRGITIRLQTFGRERQTFGRGQRGISRRCVAV